MAGQFKTADSIALDDDGYAQGILESVEFVQYTDELGEITDQIEFVWATTTRKGKETKLKLWTSLNINPIPRKINGKTSYNALTQLLLLHKLISTDDLKKIAKDDSYVEELDIDLESMKGTQHKFQLVYNERSLAKPDISTLKINSTKLNSFIK